jgi:hypothetical protein
MAIQISGTEVISNSRGLNNIASVDATTAASISAAGVGGGGTLDFTADGAISAGDVVVLNSDGTVSTVTQTSTPLSQATSGSITSPSGSDYLTNTQGIYDSTNQQVIFAGGHSSGYVGYVTGTVGSGNTITLGTLTVISAMPGGISGNRNGIAYDPVNNKVVILASQGSSGSQVIAGTPSSGSISFGSKVTVSGEMRREDYSICFEPDSSKFVVFYNNTTAGFYAYAYTVSLSGTTITTGTPIRVSSNGTNTNSNFANVIYDENINKLIFVYSDAFGDKYVYGTISGSSISVTGENYLTTQWSNMYNKWLSFDSSTNQVLYTYRSGTTTYARAFAFTSSSRSYGSEVTVATSAYGLANYHAYDSTNNNYPIVYQSNSSPYPWYIIVATVSGTTVSLNTAQQLSSGLSADMKYHAVVPDASTGKVVTYAAIPSTSNGPIVSTTATLSSDNDDWIGISTEAIADTATGTVTVIGGVNDQQSGLTVGSVYYVGNDGSLSTSTSGVKIGKALAATDLLITEGNT